MGDRLYDGVIYDEKGAVNGRNVAVPDRIFGKSFPSLYDLLYIGICCSALALVATHPAGADYWSGEASFLFVAFIGLVCIGGYAILDSLRGW